MRSKIFVLSVLCLILTSFYWNSSLKIESTQKSEPLRIREVPDEIKTNCYVCHNPKAPSHDAIVAPPLAVVKMRYSRKYRTREAFVNSMTSFLLSPTKENAIMFGAVDQFGLMPVTVLDEKTTRRIVEYIYANKLEEPAWLKDEMGNRGM
jgi:hypothetical protein